MLFKARSLFFSRSGNSMHIAQQIARHHKITSDQIPPAYPSENEKLLFVVYECNGSKPDKKFLDYCANLTPARVKNAAVCLVTRKSDESVAVVKDAIVKGGIELVGEPKVFHVRPKGLLGQHPVSEEQVKEAIAWSEQIVELTAAK